MGERRAVHAGHSLLRRDVGRGRVLAPRASVARPPAPRPHLVPEERTGAEGEQGGARRQGPVDEEDAPLVCVLARGEAGRAALGAVESHLFPDQGVVAEGAEGGAEGDGPVLRPEGGAGEEGVGA